MLFRSFMEEKANFKYDATIKLTSGEFPNQYVDDTPAEDYRIVEMMQLQPMTCQWQKPDGRAGKLCVFLDFLNEKVYDANLNTIPGNLGEAILMIVKQKKATAMPPLPDEVWQALETRKQVYEGRPNGEAKF